MTEVELLHRDIDKIERKIDALYRAKEALTGYVERLDAAQKAEAKMLRKEDR